MGREIKRVPLDFDAPLNEPWQGYQMPQHLSPDQCPDCAGRGCSPEAQHLHNLWYGYVTFKPEDNGSTPLTCDTPAVRAFAERNVNSSPEFYGEGEFAIWREAERLATLWNGQWSHHLNETDVAALVEAGRLMDLTHTFTAKDRWQPKDPPVVPTAEEVNIWSIGGFGHDAINNSVVIRARCAKDGLPLLCSTCDGDGSSWAGPEQKIAHEAWEHIEPPEGDGWQLWQTVSDGPLSPVFPEAEGLIDWMTTPAAKWGAAGPWSRENAEAFVRGPGWAPTFIGGVVPGLVVDGVTAVTR